MFHTKAHIAHVLLNKGSPKTEIRGSLQYCPARVRVLAQYLRACCSAAVLRCQWGQAISEVMLSGGGLGGSLRRS